MTATSVSKGVKNWGTGATAIERFWSRVTVTANPAKCWEWNAQRDKHGYSTSLRFLGKYYKAHIIAWMIENGRRPTMGILHKCDNPPCCNPSHLYEGTQAQNMADMALRGRSCRGERNFHAKLTASQIVDIRKARTTGMRYWQIAQTYGVSESLVHMIVNGKRWRHVK